MLRLRRVQYFNEFLRCHASGQILMYGDFYYIDDENHIISAKHYYETKMQKRRETFDESILNEAKTQKEYQDQLRLAEQEYLTSHMLDEPLEGHDAYNHEKGVYPNAE